MSLSGVNFPTAVVRVRAFIDALERDSETLAARSETPLSVAPTAVGGVASLYAEDVKAILEALSGEHVETSSHQDVIPITLVPTESLENPPPWRFGPGSEVDWSWARERERNERERVQDDAVPMTDDEEDLLVRPYIDGYNEQNGPPGPND